MCRAFWWRNCLENGHIEKVGKMMMMMMMMMVVVVVVVVVVVMTTMVKKLRQFLSM